MNVKWKVISSVMFIIVSVNILFIYMIYSQGKNNIENFINLKINSTRTLTETIETDVSDRYRKRIKNFVNPSYSKGRYKMIQAFATQDRETLLSLSKPVYHALSKEDPYFKSMGFVTKENKVFLRVHLPDVVGDKVGDFREDIAAVNSKKNQMFGHHVGIKSIQYRIIQPVRFAGEHIGVVQFGLDTKLIIDNIESKMSVTAGMVINAAEFSHQKNRDTTQIKFKTMPVIESENYMVLGNDIDYLKKVNSEMDWQLPEMRVSVGAKELIIVNVLPVQNYKKESIGHYFVVLDITETVVKNRSLLFSVILISILITIFSYLILYTSYGRLVQNIVDLNNELEESNQYLEDRVEIRTHELEAKQKEYEYLVQHSNSIVLKWNADGEIKFLNRYGFKLFGYQEGELIGKSIMELVSRRESTGRDLQFMVNDILKNPEDYILNINENICRTGEVLWVQWSNKAIYNENGDFVEMLSIGIDITELKKLEAELRQSQKLEAIGTLAGGIAHDFNNILAAIFGFTDIALLKLPLNSDIRAYIEQIQKASNRAKELVQQILAFSRKSELGYEVINASEAVTESLKLIRSSLPSTIRIEQSIQDQVNVVADQTQLHQVMMNLCTNAFHAMEMAGGVLSVSLETVEITKGDMLPGEYAHLRIKDDGVGMSEVTVGKIFEPYFTTKEQGKGTGLGLAVVHGIIVNSGGYIFVKSLQNKGTTFDIYFPMSCAHTISSSDAELPQIVNLEGNECIIFVDDEKDILHYSREFLSEFGYQVEIFESAEDALFYIEQREQKCDLVVTDLTMPEMSGLELVESIRKQGIELPIILCSGYGEGLHQDLLNEKKINFYLQKPVDIIELIQQIRQLLD